MTNYIYLLSRDGDDSVTFINKQALEEHLEDLYPEGELSGWRLDCDFQFEIEWRFAGFDGDFEREEYNVLRLPLYGDLDKIIKL